MLIDRLLFYLQFVTILFVVVVDGKRKRRRKDQFADDPMEDPLNVCQIVKPTIIYCYCDTNEMNQATEGNCWVFNDTSLKENAEIWEDFSSQSQIKHFTLHLRTDGTVNKVPTIAFMHLQQIEYFEVQYATIDSVHSFAFANSSTMQEILLSRNAIKGLEASSFANMKNVSKIHLGENQLTEINRDVFVNLPKLTDLFIEQNNITRIADYAFHNLRSLRQLDLFSNQIKVIVPTTFIGLEKLEKLDLHVNHIEVIGDKTFQYLKSLTNLDIHANSIKFISPKGFYGVSKLKKLNLKDNKLLSLGSDLFKSNEMLSYLDISQNVLETIEEDALYPIKKMLLHQDMILKLKGNTLRCDTRLKWTFALYNNTKSRSVKDALDEVYCYLEHGPLPQRFQPLPTAPYEVTTLGIGPRVRLMKLQAAELPDPLLKTMATFTEENCDDYNPKSTVKSKNSSKSKKGHRGGKKRMKHRNHLTTAETPISVVEPAMTQNDMARPRGKSTNDPELRPAAPVQESMAYNNDRSSASFKNWKPLMMALFSVHWILQVI